MNRSVAVQIDRRDNAPTLTNAMERLFIALTNQEPAAWWAPFAPAAPAGSGGVTDRRILATQPEEVGHSLADIAAHVDPDGADPSTRSSGGWRKSNGADSNRNVSSTMRDGRPDGKKSVPASNTV